MLGVLDPGPTIELAQEVKPDEVSLTIRTHMMEGENLLM